MNGRPTAPWSFLALFLALPGCFSSGTTPLAELPQPELRFDVPLIPAQHIELEIGYTLPPGADCPVIPAETKAWVNGHALELADPGGLNPGPFPPRGCVRPLFTTSLTAGELGMEQEVTTIEVDDGHTRFVFEALNVIASRMLELGQWPEDYVLKPGMEARASLSVPTDDARQPLALENRGPTPVVFRSGSGGGPQEWTLQWDAVTAESGALRFTVPASAPITSGMLYIDLPARVGVRRCDGPAVCLGLTWYSMGESVSVLP